MLYWCLFCFIFFCSLQMLINYNKIVSLINACMCTSVGIFEVMHDINILYSPFNINTPGITQLSWFYIMYTLSDTLFWTRKTNWKYFNHHLITMVFISIHDIHPNFQLKSMAIFFISELSFGNIFYHLGGLKLISRKKSFIMYTITTVLAFGHYICLWLTYWNECSLLTHIINSISFICIWRLKNAYKMYKKIYN